METRATADVDGIQLPRLIRLSDRKQTPVRGVPRQLADDLHPVFGEQCRKDVYSARP
jgi:hypothetical protein